MVSIMSTDNWHTNLYSLYLKDHALFDLLRAGRVGQELGLPTLANGVHVIPQVDLMKFLKTVARWWSKLFKFS